MDALHVGFFNQILMLNLGQNGSECFAVIVHLNLVFGFSKIILRFAIYLRICLSRFWKILLTWNKNFICYPVCEL